MTDQPTNSEADRAKAKELYAMAREMEKRRDYEAARAYYRQSLALHDDETVKTAYFDLLDTIGPE